MPMCLSQIPIQEKWLKMKTDSEISWQTDKEAAVPGRDKQTESC